ncbi:hypothetical protein BSLG_010416 [Batrachochytrium salamandrivorans]|nr:hypothetical protein BSLG_010416 [Batrachochytrium salamandrivorans]
MVDVENSKVREILVHRDFRERAGPKPRWRNFSQIPFSQEKLNEMMRNSARPQSTVNRKLAARSLFPGTYDRITKVVDITAQPMMDLWGWKNGVCWSEPPVTLLRPLEHVVAAGLNTIEIVNWKSAELRQRLTVDSTSSLRILCSRHYDGDGGVYSPNGASIPQPVSMAPMNALSSDRSMPSDASATERFSSGVSSLDNISTHPGQHVQHHSDMPPLSANQLASSSTTASPLDPGSLVSKFDGMAIEQGMGDAGFPSTAKSSPILNNQSAGYRADPRSHLPQASASVPADEARHTDLVSRNQSPPAAGVSQRPSNMPESIQASHNSSSYADTENSYRAAAPSPNPGILPSNSPSPQSQMHRPSAAAQQQQQQQQQVSPAQSYLPGGPPQLSSRPSMSPPHGSAPPRNPPRQAAMFIHK